MFWIAVEDFKITLTSLGLIKFKEYLEKFYFKDGRVQMWAGWFRIAIYIVTNNWLESYHRILKYDHFCGKILRMDECLMGLLRCLEDRLTKRAIDLFKNRTCNKALTIKHNEGANLGAHMIENWMTNEMSIAVESSQKNHPRYTVRQLRNCTDCRKRCNLCDVCIHMYVCGCESSKKEICKHMHSAHSNMKARGKIEPYRPKIAKNEISMILGKGSKSISKRMF